MLEDIALVPRVILKKKKFVSVSSSNTYRALSRSISNDLGKDEYGSRESLID